MLAEQKPHYSVRVQFEFGDAQGYLNLNAYKEFGAQNRAEGWNAWLTFALSDAPPPRRP
jgi:hypothetical protein